MQCPACHSACPDDVRFCLHCGQFLGEPNDNPTQARTPRVPPPTTVAANSTLFANHTPVEFESDYEPPRKRRWAVVVALAVLIGIALVVGTAIAFELISRSAEDRARPEAARIPTPTPLPSPTPKPTIDRDLALREVMEVENRWHQAWHDGDRELMRQVLADEFRNVSPLGTVQGKVDFVENARPTPIEVTTSNASILTIRGSTITITLTRTYYLAGKEPRSTLDTDTFVWRDGRWQITYSQSSYKP